MVTNLEFDWFSFPISSRLRSRHVVLCLYDYHVYCIIILLAQLDMLYRHPSSSCNVTNDTKTYAFPEVNTEVCVVDEELFDGKEQKEYSPEGLYKENEFGTFSDELVDDEIMDFLL